MLREGPYLCSLVIENPIWADTGIYTCAAVNEAGKATSTATLTVQGTMELATLDNKTSLG